jgi:hypothetical protein
MQVAASSLVQVYKYTSVDLLLTMKFLSTPYLFLKSDQETPVH